jgi:hypothetical protein
MGNAVSDAVKSTSFSFKGNNANDRILIFATIQGIGFDNLLQLHSSDSALKAYFDCVGTTFPDDADDLNTWLADLEDEQLAQIKSKIMEMKQ